jgi:hypothetical protein
VVINNFKKYKSQGLDRWTTKIFMNFFDCVRDDILRVVEETRCTGNMRHGINSTFIAVNPKSYCPSSFDDFRPITLYNCLYNIVAKIFVVRIKSIISNIIYEEQFGFLKGKLIH